MEIKKRLRKRYQTYGKDVGEIIKMDWMKWLKCRLYFWSALFKILIILQMMWFVAYLEVELWLIPFVGLLGIGWYFESSDRK